MVFGMICSALGPAIPWLADNAGVSPEASGLKGLGSLLGFRVQGLGFRVGFRVYRGYIRSTLGGYRIPLKGSIGDI